MFTDFGDRVGPLFFAAAAEIDSFANCFFFFIFGGSLERMFMNPKASSRVIVDTSQSPKCSRHRMSCCFRPFLESFFQLPRSIFSCTNFSINSAKNFFSNSEAGVAESCVGNCARLGWVFSAAEGMSPNAAASWSSFICSSPAAASIAR